MSHQKLLRSLHCVRPSQPCNRRRDLLYQNQGIAMSLVAARGDGARPCPPQTQPSPPPRDLVQRTSETLEASFVDLCALNTTPHFRMNSLQITKFKEQNTN